MVKKKITIIPPSKKLLSRESPRLKKGDPAGGRIESEESVAKRQHVKPRRK